jgi:hypothetical protein
MEASAMIFLVGCRDASTIASCEIILFKYMAGCSSQIDKEERASDDRE